ncbi:hypothetical protein glysoja_025862 [Glycine soja]|uniref:Uncharacterized protein n=1 Tax=Glycine soja TaxID=3848 RepID=A0A0B2R7F6_GLYSO|nr:hypothetical protein JHK87_007181 [Glycine soja]KHN30371.1 hypothetical protein glysoja_025862 [Glycine soja]
MVIKKEFGSVRQPCDHPRHMEVPKNDPLQPKMRHLQREAHQAINHALITRSWFIHQT